MGTTRYGSQTWVHVVIPLDEVADSMAALTEKFTAVAHDLVVDQVVAQKVRQQIEVIRTDVMKAERERVTRDAGVEADRLNAVRTYLERDLADARRQVTEQRARADASRDANDRSQAAAQHLERELEAVRLELESLRPAVTDNQTPRQEQG